MRHLPRIRQNPSGNHGNKINPANIQRMANLHVHQPPIPDGRRKLQPRCMVWNKQHANRLQNRHNPAKLVCIQPLRQLWQRSLQQLPAVQPTKHRVLNICHFDFSCSYTYIHANRHSDNHTLNNGNTNTNSNRYANVPHSLSNGVWTNRKRNQHRGTT